MRWEDERYVRVYTRDTADWLLLPWEGRCVFVMLLRVADRAGFIPLGRHGMRGLSTVIHLPEEVTASGMKALMEDGCVAEEGNRLVIPNFIEAQETRSTDAQRKRDQRERERNRAILDAPTQPIELPIDESHQMSQTVTSSHQESPAVTLYCAVPSCAVPSSTTREREKPRVAKVPNPRFAPLKDKLVAEYESARGGKYGFNGGRDAKAISSLLAKGTDDEVLARWKVGLGVHPSWRSHCANIHDLDTKWNLLVGESNTKQSQELPNGMKLFSGVPDGY